METSPTEPITLEKLRTEAKRVAKSHNRIFIKLTLLFLLPPSLIAVLFQTVKPIINRNPNPNPNEKKIDVLLALGAYIFSIIFSLSATASITFTAFHGFIDQPIKLRDAIRSIAASFFRLLATLLLFQAIVFVLTFLFVFVGFRISGALTQLGFASIASSKYFLLFFAAILIVVLIYLQVNWFLVNSVVVVESRRGFDALKRSRTLIRGNKRIALYLLIVFGALYLILFWNIRGRTGPIEAIFVGNFDTGSLIVSVVIILMTSWVITMAQSSSLVLTTVLYGLCKESHGGDEYFSLLVSDEKVASVV